MRAAENNPDTATRPGYRTFRAASRSGARETGAEDARPGFRRAREGSCAQRTCRQAREGIRNRQMNSLNSLQILILTIGVFVARRGPRDTPERALIIHDNPHSK